MIDSLQRHLLLALGIVVCLGLLAILVGIDLGGDLPIRPTVHVAPVNATNVVQARQLEEVFSLAEFATRKPAADLSNPFYQPQVHPPAPPAPKTRKVELTFLGFFTTTHGEKRAYLQIGDQMLVGAIGVKVVADLIIADITPQNLILKDAAAKETPLPFRVKQTVEVPL